MANLLYIVVSYRLWKAFTPDPAKKKEQVRLGIKLLSESYSSVHQLLLRLTNSSKVKFLIFQAKSKSAVSSLRMGIR